MLALKHCPFSDKHRVYGGYPVFVCSECGTEWTVFQRGGCKYVRYVHFSSDGEIIREWKEKIREVALA
jgi:uncharacterized Zn ribbon protein